MCGISGVFNKEKNNLVAQSLVKKMCDMMIHRGPDEEGYYFNGNIGLGMRRLKIIDLSTGSQPIFNEDKSIVIIFNGEIYNFKELKDILCKKGHKFYTQTDTEVIVHLYEDYGRSFVQFLNGMFAIALWDDRKKELLLFRDRLGKKPLHYSIINDGIVFSSEIKSISCDERVKKEIDKEALLHYFTFGYIPAPYTIYSGVRKLPAGHYLLYKEGRSRIEKYWDVIYKPDFSKNEEYFSNKLFELLNDSVRIRLVSDVPLGAFLSGGIDSSIIVGLMSTLSNQPVKTFSIGFYEKEYNELDYAKVVAKKFNTEHYEFIVHPSAVSLIDKLIGFLDEPFGDFSVIPTFLVSELTKKYVTVALSGDGGDELFGGYDSYLRILKRRNLRFIPLNLRKVIANSLGNWLPDFSKGKAFLQSLPLDDLTYFFLGLSENRKRMLFSNDFIDGIQTCSSFNIINNFISENPIEFLNQFMYIDTKLYLPDDILVKVDRMSMANSLETRAPFLDYRLVEFAATIPSNLKIKKVFNGYISKFILKKSMNKLLPETILNRKKQGFCPPIEKWFANELKEMILDTFSYQKIKSIGIFNENYILKVLREHLEGRRKNTMFLWQIFIFLLWYDKFFKNQSFQI